jgi:hypothetical protein
MEVQDHENWINYTLPAVAVITYQCRQTIHVKDFIQRCWETACKLDKVIFRSSYE